MGVSIGRSSPIRRNGRDQTARGAELFSEIDAAVQSPVAFARLAGVLAFDRHDILPECVPCLSVLFRNIDELGYDTTDHKGLILI